MQAFGVVVFVIAAALSTSLAGAGVAASPVTLPLMYLLVRLRPTRAFRIAGAVIGGVTALEVGATLGGVVFGDHTLVAWALGALSMAVAAAAFGTAPRSPSSVRDHAATQANSSLLQPTWATSSWKAGK